MAASMEDAVPKIDWLYPELLSKEGLIEILSMRFVKLPDDLENTTKDELIQLYYTYIIPRPQRKYRLNRRGQEMTKKQVLAAKKRKITGPDYSQPPAKKSAPQSSHLLSSFDGIAVGNRLKPPPSCVNFEKKVIKLGASKSPNAASASMSNSTEDKTATGPSAPKVIKLNRSSSDDPQHPTSAQSTISAKKTIQLINSHLSPPGKVGDAKQAEETKKEEEPMESSSTPSPTKKVKIKRIAWP